MTEYEKGCAMLYLKLSKIFKNGIKEDKYFYNAKIFTDDNGALADYVKTGILSFVKSSFPEGKRSMYSLSYYNSSSCPVMSLIKMAKDIGMNISFDYYSNKFKENGKVDLNMDVRNFNISLKGLQLIKEILASDSDTITLGEIFKINKYQVLNWTNNSKFNKKDALALVAFCDNIVCDFDSLNDPYCVDLYEAESMNRAKQIISSLSLLEKQYNEVHSKKIELELLEKKLETSIGSLKGELLEIRSNCNNKNRIRNI